MSEHIMITGGDGYVGRALARSYLLHSDARLTLQLRAKDSEQARSKRAALEADLPDCEAGRVKYIHTDLTARDPFAEVGGGVTAIVHTAAVTRFNVERELALAVNVEGTKKVLDFAERCPRLQALGLLSTVYSCGMTQGQVTERSCPESAAFANHYEWSKFESEACAERHPDLPLRIIRIATLLADDGAGRVTQYNALHNTLRLYYYGLLSLVPGECETPVYLVTGDFVSRAVFQLMQSRVAAGFYHVAHQSQHNPTLGEFVNLAFDAFERHEEFRRKRILRPLFVDEEAFAALAHSAETFGSPITQQAFRSVTPFARQLYVNKQLDNARMQAELGDYAPPDYRTQLGRAVDYLVATKWGRQAAGAAAAAPEPQRSVDYAV